MRSASGALRGVRDCQLAALLTPRSVGSIPTRTAGIDDARSKLSGSALSGSARTRDRRKIKGVTRRRRGGESGLPPRSPRRRPTPSLRSSRPAKDVFTRAAPPAGAPRGRGATRKGEHAQVPKDRHGKRQQGGGESERDPSLGGGEERGRVGEPRVVRSASIGGEARRASCEARA